MKFNIGDEVKVIRSGNGCHPNEVGEIVKIVERKENGYLRYTPRQHGYKTNPKVSNEKGGFFDGWSGEKSFELISVGKTNNVKFLSSSVTQKEFDRICRTKNFKEKCK